MANRRKRKRPDYDDDEDNDKEINLCSSVPYIPINHRNFSGEIRTEDDACACATKINDENYNMCHKKRGRAIIFNHYMCHGHTQPRRGTECDVMRLGRTLSNILKFDVRVYEDLTYCQIMDVLLKLSKENFGQEDCLAVFVLTHGTLHGLTASDETYDVEDLWKYFVPPKCPSLAGKPKLFFINSCRGKKFDEGVVYENKDAEASSNESSIKGQSYRAPIYADFLTFYSTMEGFTSLRHPAHGTWFIQSLCETLENKNYRKLEVKQILTVTTRKTALKCNNYLERVCQIPTMMSTLMRNVYFFPNKQI